LRVRLSIFQSLLTLFTQVHALTSLCFIGRCCGRELVAACLVPGQSA
jgi:hypothetical protein